MYQQELAELVKEAGVVELAEIWGETNERDKKKLELFKAIIRVRYEADTMQPSFVAGQKAEKKRKIFDRLFMVYGKLVVPWITSPLYIKPLHDDGGPGYARGFNRMGREENNDDWPERFRAELSKTFPAIKRRP
jgi:hypothetical protein